MNTFSHRSPARIPVFIVLAALTAGCGAGTQKGTETALTARLEQLEKENADHKKLIKQLSTRITELENLALKQGNELKKVKVAAATKPKTLVPVPPEPVEAAPVWNDEPVVVAAGPAPEPAQDDGEDGEPRPLLKLYGLPSIPSSGSSSSGTVQPAALLTDTASIGSMVPLKLPAHGGQIPEVDEALDTAGGPAAVDPYEQGVVKYKSKEWSNAILYFDIYLKHKPTGPKVMNTIFLKAESLYQMKKYLDAIGQFELILERYPKSPRAAEARFRVARCYEKLGDKSKAASIYQQIVLDHPESTQAKKAGKLLKAMK